MISTVWSSASPRMSPPTAPGLISVDSFRSESDASERRGMTRTSLQLFVQQLGPHDGLSF